MANMIESTIDEGKERIEDLQAETRKRALQLKRDLELNQGRLKQASLETVYSLGETLLRRTAGLAGNVPGVDTRALKERATGLETARHELVQPAIEGYDELNVKTILLKMKDLNAWELDKIKRYEAKHKARKTVIREADRRLNAA